MPGLPFHPQLHAHQQTPPEEDTPAPNLNLSDDQLINVTSDPSPVKSAEVSPEKKKKKRTKKKVELGPDGEPLPKTPKAKSPKGPRKKKVKDQEKADQIVAEAIAKAQATNTEEPSTPVVAPNSIPTLVSEIADSTLEETDTINITDISGTEALEPEPDPGLEVGAETDAKKPSPKKKKSKKEGVPKEKKEKKEKKAKTPKARPSKKK